MSKRIKVKIPEVKSREEVANLVGEITAFNAELAQRMGQMAEIIEEVKAEFGPGITELEKEIKTKTEMVYAWAMANGQEFDKRKSITFLSGVIGFRTGTPKLKTLRGFTWESVLHSLKLLALVKYIRVKEEIDKEGLISDRALLEKPGLEALGLKIVQEESFYVEPNLEQPETKSKCASARAL